MRAMQITELARNAWPRGVVASAIALSTVAALAGCGVARGEADAKLVASTFFDALREDEGTEACALLAQATREEREESTGGA